MGNDSNAKVVIAGAIVGGSVLGIGGRLATAGVALLIGDPPNLSLAGVLEVILIGTAVGAIGGLMLVPLERSGGNPAWRRGVLLGATLFAGCWLASWVSGRLAGTFDPVTPLTLGVVLIVFLIYGVVVAALASRTERNAA
jgi:hypothetical protein